MKERKVVTIIKQEGAPDQVQVKKLGFGAAPAEEERPAPSEEQVETKKKVLGFQPRQNKRKRKLGSFLIKTMKEG